MGICDQHHLGRVECIDYCYAIVSILSSIPFSVLVSRFSVPDLGVLVLYSGISIPGSKVWVLGSDFGFEL
jgi:hypothetical protein